MKGKKRKKKKGWIEEENGIWRQSEIKKDLIPRMGRFSSRTAERKIPKRAEKQAHQGRIDPILKRVGVKMVFPDIGTILEKVSAKL